MNFAGNTLPTTDRTEEYYVIIIVNIDSLLMELLQLLNMFILLRI